MSRCGWLRRHKYAIQDTKVGDAMMPGLVEEHGTHPKYTLGRYTEFLLRCERCGHIKVDTVVGDWNSKRLLPGGNNE